METLSISSINQTSNFFQRYYFPPPFVETSFLCHSDQVLPSAMNFHGLTRKELQALCKKNKIPANRTNSMMANALQSLPTVQGIEEISQSGGNVLDPAPSRKSSKNKIRLGRQDEKKGSMLFEKGSEAQHFTIPAILSTRLESVSKALKNLAGEIFALDKVVEKLKEDVDMTLNIPNAGNLFKVVVKDVNVGLLESSVGNFSSENSEAFETSELPNRFVNDEHQQLSLCDTSKTLEIEAICMNNKDNYDSEHNMIAYVREEVLEERTASASNLSVGRFACLNSASLYMGEMSSITKIRSKNTADSSFMDVPFENLQRNGGEVESYSPVKTMEVKTEREESKPEIVADTNAAQLEQGIKSLNQESFNLNQSLDNFSGDEEARNNDPQLPSVGKVVIATKKKNNIPQFSVKLKWKQYWLGVLGRQRRKLNAVPAKATERGKHRYAPMKRILEPREDKCEKSDGNEQQVSAITAKTTMSCVLNETTSENPRIDDAYSKNKKCLALRCF